MRSSKLRVERIRGKQEIGVIGQFLAGEITESAAARRVTNIRKQNPQDEVPPAELTQERIATLSARNKEIGRELAENKRNLKELLAANTEMRSVRPECIKPSAVISIFESSLTRTLGLKTNELTDNIIIVSVFFFEVFHSLVHNGFMMNGHKYVFLSASAGQIRTKKAVMVREDLWLKHQKTIMCGLTIDRINELGGCNTNKFLAYLALCNSATEPWLDFDIDKCIVVEDMETCVRGMVDHIDGDTYDIRRVEMEIPITHTDGCGMVLPHLTGGKNMMVRLPWIKGLLGVFQFDEFVRQASEAYNRNCGIVKDIYGKEHDVLAEDIQVILTKSQFKMWKYYSDFDEYRAMFKQYGCEAGTCNVEDDHIDNATINYQMLQTLNGMTDSELTAIASSTNYKLRHLSSDKKTMLRALGATNGNPNKTAFQECLLLYPELLQDAYTREELRNMKNSIQKQAWAGKLDIYGKYLFVIPDLYAFCEWLFVGDENPRGLLQDGEVYAELFPRSEKLDCLRSPHLYREHTVRRNVCGDPTRGLCQVWFSERAIYTSCHDLISKVLMFDNDGDKLLCVADKTLIAAAERHMQDIVPLDYDMRKAAATPITLDSVYNGMTAAYTGGNIGPISNTISKIWNMDEPDLDTIKRLCYVNNLVIDYAKTLYKNTPPEEVQSKIQSYSKQKLPYFFMFAKNKSKQQVVNKNKSVVNRLSRIVPKTRLNFRANKSGKFDYRMLMHNPKLICTRGVEDIIREYSRVSRRVRINPRALVGGMDAYTYQFQTLREHMFALNDSPQFVVDSIIYGIFGRSKSTRKRLFWGAFGDIVLDNLKSNLDLQMSDYMLCSKCLTRFSDNTFNLVCPSCGFRHVQTKEIRCEDCGEMFLIDVRNTSKKRCDACQESHRRRYKNKK